MQHKWHKEIKAWADGADIEFLDKDTNRWITKMYDGWDIEAEYRIKPQPISNELKEKLIKGVDEILNKYQSKLKEPQYLYSFIQSGDDTVRQSLSPLPRYKNEMLIGKIKLEVDDESTNSN